MNRLLWAMLALVAFLQGCANVTTGGFEVSISEKDAGTYRMHVDDTGFARDIIVDRAIAHRDASGFLSATVMIRNMNKGDFPVQYKFMFFDANGMVIRPDERGWEQKVLHGGEAGSLFAIAPTKSVASFTVRVRRVN